MGGAQSLFVPHLCVPPHPQAPHVRVNQAESLFDLEKGLMGQGRSQTYQKINQVTNVNITRNGTKRHHMPLSMTQR